MQSIIVFVAFATALVPTAAAPPDPTESAAKTTPNDDLKAVVTALAGEWRCSQDGYSGPCVMLVLGKTNSGRFSVAFWNERTPSGYEAAEFDAATGVLYRGANRYAYFDAQKKRLLYIPDQTTWKRP